MSSSAKSPSKRTQEQLFHDILNHLHIIELGLERLPHSRNNSEEFESLCALMNEERKKASEVVLTLRDRGRKGAGGR